jgi:hypothetical protein
VCGAVRCPAAALGLGMGSAALAGALAEETQPMS